MGAFKDLRLAKSNIKKFTDDFSKVLCIHYSQSKTYDEDDYGNISPIITSIVIKSLDNQIDKQFAIHFEADKADIPIEQIQDSYRELEMRMLKSYNEFVKRHCDYKWVHWDMKNIHFGFEAIKHRYEKIFGSLKDYSEIPINNKKNLRDILEAVYGENFVEGPDFLKSLFTLNSEKLSSDCFLDSTNESLEFENKNFSNVIKSVDVKVDFIKIAVKKFLKNKLVVSQKNRFAIILEFANGPVFTFIGWIATISGFILTVLQIIL